MTTKKDWSHNSSFLSESEADYLYRRMKNAPWSQPAVADDSVHCLFGLSYGQTPGGKEENPIIPEFLKMLAERVATSPHVQMPSNYVQCRRMIPSGMVRPHRDPSGMIVPMLTLGQERAFRVAGDFPSSRHLPQAKRPIESHIPEDEILMKAGDLLVFNGGRTAHSMFPAAQDTQFNQNGCDYRISILFRYTTQIMRDCGCNRMRWSPTQVQQHEDEYRAVQVRWMEAHQMQSVLF